MLFVCFTTLGCATRSETFDVSVKNESAQPVTVWLTKDGPPEEDGWRSPESIAINFVVKDEKIGGVIVPTGKTATTGKRKARLERGTSAVLRVYRGEMRMSELLANGADSPDRADVTLNAGVNRLVVREAQGRLNVAPAGQIPPVAAPAPPSSR